jgi:hypothetical protein
VDSSRKNARKKIMAKAKMVNWVTRDYGGEGKAVTLSKNSMGEFLYWLSKLGGNITSTWIMNKEYDKSYCQFGIQLPEGKEAEFTEKSGFVLETPAALHLA